MAFKVVIAAMMLFFSSQSARTEQVGRYQMVPTQKSPNSFIDQVVVLDTTTGEMWTWTQSPATGNSPGFNGIRYLGRASPGAKPGDIVSKAWPRADSN